MAQGLGWEKIQEIRQKSNIGVKKTRICENVGVCFKTVKKYANMSEEEIQEIKEERRIGTEEEKGTTEEEEPEEKSFKEELKEEVTEGEPEEEFEFDEDLTRYEVLNQFARFRDIVTAFDKVDIDYESEEKEQIIDELFKEGLIREEPRGLVITGKGWRVISTLREKGGEEYNIVREPVEFEMKDILPEGTREENKEEIKEELELGEKAREVKEKVNTLLDKDLNNKEFKELLRKAMISLIAFGPIGDKIEKKTAAAKKLSKKYSKKAREERKKRQAVEIFKLAMMTGKNLPKKIVNKVASYL